MKRILLILMALVFLCGALTGCKAKENNESAAAPDEVVNKAPDEVVSETVDQPQAAESNGKMVLSSTSSYPRIEKNDVLRDAEIILLGTVTETDGGVMTNPDLTLKDEKGQILSNMQLTTYTIEIDELYKGDYTDETIKLYVTNGYGLSPELILYGEDETTIWADWEQEVLRLEVGTPAIFALKYHEKSDLAPAGYYLETKKTGYLPRNEKGEYQTVHWPTPITLDPATMKDDITAALSE
ncbi:MAG: hypothetical protein IJP27_02285 [Clostridia bacterium]|nr:hypothetical protein [Clostridia bacterium]